MSDAVIMPAALTKKQAAFYTSLSVRSLERLVSGGRLTMVRLTPGSLRFLRTDLDAFLEACPYDRDQRPG